MNAFALSLYVGYGLYAVFPYMPTVLKWGNTHEIKFALTLGVYLIAVALSMFILKRFVLNSYAKTGIAAIVLGLLSLGFILAMLYHVFGITALFNLPSYVNALFAPSGVFFYWFIAPLVGLYFVNRN